jgi:hypothetical protein
VLTRPPFGGALSEEDIRAFVILTHQRADEAKALGDRGRAGR